MIEGSEITILKRYLHPHVHCSIIHSSQDMETTYVSTDGQIKKMWYMCKMEYYLAITKRVLPFGTKWMDLEGIVLSEIS